MDWLSPADRQTPVCGADDGDEERPEAPQVLVATFAAPRARLDELEAVQAFAQAYHRG
ncbi:hypothetical protein WMF37_51475 [Sorangium sp. So ce291]|uniref:hypothetical protein n=1 Tax=Sorangium sp. So ce291 TaxID=3133294 RepID=UPI003F62BA25